MGNEYHHKVNRHIAKHDARDLAQAESLAPEPDDVENNRDDRNGVCKRYDEFMSASSGRQAHQRQA